MPDRYLGRQIGKYRVIRLLGAGAFAWVYEAIDRDLEIPVALKILRPEFAGQADAEVRFRREASTAAKLRHPNIVTVRDVGQVDGAAFVAMDLHPLSLARRLELVTRLPEPEVVRVGLDVAAALAIAHAGGVIHRDIKPDNILIGPHGEAIVADFGLARALSNDAALSATNQVMGTPHYFSPEQARGQEIDGRSDLYSLGVTLYRAITGKLPFEGDDWYEVAKQHVESQPVDANVLVPDITPAFCAALMRLLAKRPEERFQSATQLADALATLPTAPLDRGTSMTPHSASRTVIEVAPSVGTVVRRRRTRTLVGAGIAAVAAVALWSARGAILPGASTTATPAPIDSNAVPPTGTRGDSIGADTVQRDSLELPAPRPTPPNTATSSSRPRPAPLRVPVSFVARENANLYVNDSLVGRGRWADDLPPTPQVKFRAVIANQSPTDCPTASFETYSRISAGKPVLIDAPVRGCTGVQLQITNGESSAPVGEAEVRFIPTDGAPPRTVRVDATPTFVMPTGQYEIRVVARGCAEFTSTREVQRQLNDAPVVIRVRLICGGQ